ncbi:MAG TPA: hypothetical protein DIT01_00530 [Lentisphaeria bacterium]|nr:hypothetical protein [Lentisphaeria bacterium]
MNNFDAWIFCVTGMVHRLLNLLFSLFDILSIMGNINLIGFELGLPAHSSATLQTFSVYGRVYGISTILTLSILL